MKRLYGRLQLTALASTNAAKRSRDTADSDDSGASSKTARTWCASQHGRLAIKEIVKQSIGRAIEYGGNQKAQQAVCGVWCIMVLQREINKDDDRRGLLFGH